MYSTKPPSPLSINANNIHKSVGLSCIPVWDFKNIKQNTLKSKENLLPSTFALVIIPHFGVFLQIIEGRKTAEIT